MTEVQYRPSSGVRLRRPQPSLRGTREPVRLSRQTGRRCGQQTLVDDAAEFEEKHAGEKRGRGWPVAVRLLIGFPRGTSASESGPTNGARV